MSSRAVRVPMLIASLTGFALAVVSITVQATPWQLQLGVARGVPGGFIQVRENDVTGTPLPLGPGLGIDYVQRFRISAINQLDPSHALVISVEFARLHGQTVRPTPVDFNGVQLVADSPLTSDASWMNNWQLTGLYRQQLWESTAGFRLNGEIGFTYVGLTYSLQGHPADATNPSELSGDRTSEDFITQELPVPQLGVRLSYPLTPFWDMEANFLGGHLPRLYSMRNEGGKVYVTQTNQEVQAGLVYHWRNDLQVGFGWYERYFMQNEQSTEDGNYIQLTEHGYYLNLLVRF